MRHLLIGAAACALLACADTGTDTGTDTPAPAPDAAPAATTGIALDYERFVLDNGLEVILHRDASDPIVAMTTVIHAGSNRERPGRTGFAHFFEHMAFNDSENVPVGANRRDIPSWGGSRNGYTTRDRTVYYETVPKDAFDKLLWIVSDRLGYMINTVTPAALEREKQVVKNEKRQRVDNAPYGYGREIVPAALYPEDHPYHWPVIGSLPDLQAATLDDVRAFYDAWYGPQNATLSIVGDIDIEQTKAKVRYWFGEIEGGPDIAKPEPRPVELAETKTLMWEDNFAKLPELRLHYPTPADFDADEYPLSLLAAYLGGSKASPLYRRVVEEAKLAPSVSAYHSAEQLAGEFVIRVRAKAGTDLDAVLAEVDAAMEDFAAEGIPADELDRFKASTETQTYGRLSTVLGKAQALAIDNEFAGDPAYSTTVPDRIRAVGGDDVARVFRDHIAGQPRIVLSMVPKGQAELAVEGSEAASVWIEDVGAAKASEAVSQGEEAQYKKTQTVADRSEPAFGALPLSGTAPFWEAELPGGVSLIGTTSEEVPLAEFSVVFGGGANSDAVAGTSQLLARLLEEGTQTRTAAEIERELGRLGAGLSVSAGRDEVTLTVSTLARNLEPVAEIVADVVAQPRFTEDALERVRAAQLSSIRSSDGNPSAVAYRVFAAEVYGTHPGARTVAGAVEDVSALTLDDLRARHARLGAGGVRIVFAGAADEATARDAFKPLAEAIGAALPRGEGVVPPPARAGGNAGRVVFIDIPGSKQSVIRAGRLVAGGGTPELQAVDFANETLGGSIGADLAQTLRIEKGYTYGAYSGASGNAGLQPWSVGTSVRANATRDSLRIIAEMLGGYAQGFDDDRVERTRAKIVKDLARSQESLGARRAQLARKAKFGLPDDYVEAEQRALMAMERDDYAAVSEAFAPRGLVWVIVGDGETQRESVRDFARELGGTFVEYGVDGAPVGG